MAEGMIGKILLIEDLPISKVHGATKGREFEIIRITPKGKGRDNPAKYWFIGDTGEECAAFGRECVVKLEKEDDDDG